MNSAGINGDMQSIGSVGGFADLCAIADNWIEALDAESIHIETYKWMTVRKIGML
jgi:hypothetical protein